MGVLTDLIIGTHDELAEIPAEEVPSRVLPGLDIKGTGLIELVSLYMILTGVEFDSAFGEFPPVSGEGSEEGPWVFRFPNALVQRLATLSPPELSTVAVKWAETEEIQLGGWTVQKLELRLKEISGFAASATKQDKPVHIWTSL
jgi:hypothetical protein